MTRREMVSLDEIDPDGGTQFRAGLDPAQLASLAEALADGVTLDPPSLARLPGGRFAVIDGFHRLRVLADAGAEAVLCEVIDAADAAAARWLAAAANRAHRGLPRDPGARRRAVEAAIQARPHLSNAVVAEHVGVSESTVKRIRAALEESGLPQTCRRVGKDGRERDVSAIGAPPTPSMTELGDDPGGSAGAFAGSEDGETARRREAGRLAAANARAPMNDGTGAAVPDHLRDDFADGVLAAEADALDALADAVAPAAAGSLRPARRGVFRFLGPNVPAELAAAEQALRAAAAGVRAGVPHAVCPACRGAAPLSGAACPGCRGCGHVPRWRLEELRGEAP